MSSAFVVDVPVERHRAAVPGDSTDVIEAYEVWINADHARITVS